MTILVAYNVIDFSKFPTLIKCLSKKCCFVFLKFWLDMKTVIENITEDCEKFLQDYKQRFLQTEALSKSLQQREDELKKKERKLLKGKRKLELKKRVVQGCVSHKACFLCLKIPFLYQHFLEFSHVYHFSENNCRPANIWSTSVTLRGK